MLQWTERQIFDYTPPDDHPAPPSRPRSSWTAEGEDGALLEAFRWGSPLGAPFVLEVRRHGFPGDPDDADGPLPAEPAELPTLGELQSAADELVPPGVVLALGVVSNGPDATYPSSPRFRAVRMIQAGAFAMGSPA